MPQEPLSDEELQEIRALHTLFEELDLDVVYSVYVGCNRDRHEATKELGELVQQPQKLEMYVANLVQRMRPPGGPCPSMGDEEGGLPSSRPTLPSSYGAGIDGRDVLPAMQVWTRLGVTCLYMSGIAAGSTCWCEELWTAGM
ncbi:hypothetical protein DUNSADRAFT_2662 [Dunaliella salina]|uniref:Uncharacterized protein n=1 Tax=Dunaliella salina TaxID=3046 RepID=A0ABQ7H868_DUNSA|nr:hypothetical protein DUNSADRAFT_2662 [Dunaliella salina]|eukprot:KAF5843049.1 hypothetical protein DUNSADRAFT_2662 [Dunaliella salina]